MTESKETARCRYCRRPLPESRGPGRPALYCKRAHRQRAYEARRRAARSSLDAGEVVAARRDVDRLRDMLYVLEAALDDVCADLAELAPGAAAPVRAATYEAALGALRDAAQNLRGVVLKPSRA